MGFISRMLYLLKFLPQVMDRNLAIEFLVGLLCVIFAAWYFVKSVDPEKFLALVWENELKVNVNITGIIVFLYGIAFFMDVPYGFLSVHFFIMPALIVATNALEVKTKRYKRMLHSREEDYGRFFFVKYKKNFLGMLVALSIIYFLFFVIYMMLMPNYLYSIRFIVLIVMYIMHIIELFTGLYAISYYYSQHKNYDPVPVDESDIKEKND